MQSRTLVNTVLGITVATLMSVAHAQSDNSNSKVAPAASFPSWMTDHSKTNQGRISRDAYMAEAGRRWDGMDQNRQGLTVDQVHSMHGYPGTVTAGKDTRPGSMSPDNVKK